MGIIEINIKRKEKKIKREINIKRKEKKIKREINIKRKEKKKRKKKKKKGTSADPWSISSTDIFIIFLDILEIKATVKMWFETNMI